MVRNAGSADPFGGLAYDDRFDGLFLRFPRFDFVFRFFRPQSVTPIITATTPTTIGRIAPIEMPPPIVASRPTLVWKAKAGEEVTKTTPALSISRLQPTTSAARVVVGLRSTSTSPTRESPDHH